MGRGRPLLGLETLHSEVIHFIKNSIIYKFGITQTHTIDQGTTLTSSKVQEVLQQFDIKMVQSSPFYIYAQANGHVEVSNKIIIELIKKNIEDKPRR